MDIEGKYFPPFGGTGDGHSPPCLHTINLSPSMANGEAPNVRTYHTVSR